MATSVYEANSTSLVYDKKSELMLLRRARAHSSSCWQVGLILVYVHPFCLSSLFCSWKSQKFTKTPLFRGWRSFKVIDVDIFKKLVASACWHDRQNTVIYL